MQSYFEGRKICIVNIELDIRAGIPQGSILGPLLWIVFYYDLLRFKVLGVTQVGFADDLVLKVMAETVEYIANRALDMVVRWN